jgi:hypothetical protein
MLVRTVSVAVVAAAVGCAPTFEPIRAPAKIVVTDKEISGAEFLLIERAAREWNAARAGTVVSVSRGDGPERGIYECDVIYVSRMHTSAECDAMAVSGCARADGCNAYVLLADEREKRSFEGFFVSVVKHEIGHALLGPDHSNEPGSIMSQPLVVEDAAERGITASEASMVRTEHATRWPRPRSLPWESRPPRRAWPLHTTLHAELPEPQRLHET